MSFPAFERYRIRSGMDSVDLVPEEQGSDYESARAEIDSRIWRIRTARVTSTKPGAFVAVWRRAADGTTEPFSSSDECDRLMVFVEDGSKFGAFVFSREDLLELGIVQHRGVPGKRGFRVYPSWCTMLNAQATRTQRAQAHAFIDLSE